MDRHWAIDSGYGNEAMPLNLPLSAAKQVVTYSARQNEWIGSESELALLYIALCK